MQDERRVHVYARGREFVVVPVCNTSDGDWVECEPVQKVGLTRGLPHVALLGSAIEEAAACDCETLRPWQEGARYRQHHLFAVLLVWRAETLHMLILPDGEPCAEWPRDYSAEVAARQLLTQLNEALR
jgi:hypothetical protein